MGPKIAKPAGNHQPGHSIASIGSSVVVRFLRKIAAMLVNERATLRQSSRNDVSPDDTRIAAAGHTIQLAIASSPKSMRWRARERVGRRVRWYKTVEEVL